MHNMLINADAIAMRLPALDARVNALFWNELKRVTGRRLDDGPADACYRARWLELRDQLAARHAEMTGAVLNTETDHIFRHELQAKIGARLSDSKESEQHYRRRWLELRAAFIRGDEEDEKKGEIGEAGRAAQALVGQIGAGLSQVLGRMGRIIAQPPDRRQADPLPDEIGKLPGVLGRQIGVELPRLLGRMGRLLGIAPEDSRTDVDNLINVARAMGSRIGIEVPHMLQRLGRLLGAPESSRREKDQFIHDISGIGTQIGSGISRILGNTGRLLGFSPGQERKPAGLDITGMGRQIGSGLSQMLGKMGRLLGSGQHQPRGPDILAPGKLIGSIGVEINHLLGSMGKLLGGKSDEADISDGATGNQIGAVLGRMVGTELPRLLGRMGRLLASPDRAVKPGLTEDGDTTGDARMMGQQLGAELPRILDRMGRLLGKPLTADGPVDASVKSIFGAGRQVGAELVRVLGVIGRLPYGASHSPQKYSPFVDGLLSVGQQIVKRIGSVLPMVLQKHEWMGEKVLAVMDWVKERADALLPGIAGHADSREVGKGNKILEAVDWAKKKAAALLSGIARPSRSLGERIGEGARVLGRAIRSTIGWFGGRAQGVRDWIGDRVRNIRDWVGDRAQGVRDWVGDRAQGVRDWVGDRAQGVRDWFGGREPTQGDQARGIGQLISRTVDWVGDRTRSAGRWVTGRARGIVSPISGIAEGIRRNVRTIAQFAGQIAQTVTRPIGTAVRTIGSSIGRNVQRVTEMARRTVRAVASPVSRLVRRIQEPIVSLVRQAGNWISRRIGILSSIGSRVTSTVADTVRSAAAAASGQEEGFSHAGGSTPGGQEQVQHSGDSVHPRVNPIQLRSALIRQGGTGFAPDSDLRHALNRSIAFDTNIARFHHGPPAATAARALNAEAFTIGRDVFFGQNRYDPVTSRGRGLIAHELTHVRQQTGAGGDNAMRFATQEGGDAMEAEAQQARNMVLTNVVVSAVLTVGEYSRIYESDEESISEDDQQRLDEISMRALEIVKRRLGAEAMAMIDVLEVSLELDLERMSNEEAAEVWAHAIFDLVQRRLQDGAARQAGKMRNEDRAKAVQRWGHGGHVDLTRMAAAVGGLTEAETNVAVSHSNDPDYSIHKRTSIINILPNYLPKFLGIATRGEGVNHGEGLNYTNPDWSANAEVNKAAVSAKVVEAIMATEYFNPTLPHMKILGWALHMAQDRGSHWEGTKGMGHDDPRTMDGSGYDTDNPKDNVSGFINAFQYSVEVVNAWKSANWKQQMATVNAPTPDQSLLGGEDDNEALQFIKLKKAAGQLPGIPIDIRIKMIRSLIKGVCRDEEEQAVNDVLLYSSPQELETIVSALGNGSLTEGIDFLDSGIDGAEWKTCKSILSRNEKLKRILAGENESVVSPAPDPAMLAAKKNAIAQLWRERGKLAGMIKSGVDMANSAMASPFDRLFANSCQWISQKTGNLRFVALSPTHDFDKRVSGQIAYFDATLPYDSNSEGDYPLDSSVTKDSHLEIEDPSTSGLNYPDGRIAIMQPASRPDPELKSTIIHEVQHSADLHRAGDAFYEAVTDTESEKQNTPRFNYQRDANRFKSEFRAYWVEGGFIKPGDATAAENTKLVEYGTRPKQQTHFKTKNQEIIFWHLVDGYEYVPYWYTISQSFRDIVDNFDQPVSGNPINSTRIQMLVTAIKKYGERKELVKLYASAMQSANAAPTPYDPVLSTLMLDLNIKILALNEEDILALTDENMSAPFWLHAKKHLGDEYDFYRGEIYAKAVCRV